MLSRQTVELDLHQVGSVGRHWTRSWPGLSCCCWWCWSRSAVRWSWDCEQRLGTTSSSVPGWSQDAERGRGPAASWREQEGRLELPGAELGRSGCSKSPALPSPPLPFPASLPPLRLLPPPPWAAARWSQLIRSNCDWISFPHSPVSKPCSPSWPPVRQYCRPRWDPGSPAAWPPRSKGAGGGLVQSFDLVVRHSVAVRQKKVFKRNRPVYIKARRCSITRSVISGM